MKSTFDATASLIEDPHERAFQSAFYRNGLALVEVNLGAPQEALRLVDECIEMLDRQGRTIFGAIDQMVVKYDPPG